VNRAVVDPGTDTIRVERIEQVLATDWRVIGDPDLAQVARVTVSESGAGGRSKGRSARAASYWAQPRAPPKVPGVTRAVLQWTLVRYATIEA
jgi:hypothetical protein